METNTPHPSAKLLVSNEGSPEHANGSAQARQHRAHRTVDRLATVVHEATDQFVARGEAWQAVQDRLVSQTRDRVRQRPLAIVGIALAVGFLMSRLMR
jgi:ElaB/YqjD/DUF883 family membrane-anchored ribosome-binding protein